MSHILVTGGTGYKGSVLVPKLLRAGHNVTVLDICEGPMPDTQPTAGHGLYTFHKGDIRRPDHVKHALTFSPEIIGPVDTVIHLACISNDPSFDMDPAVGKSINYDCFRPLVRACKDVGVKRFIYASSSAVYGVKQEADVIEEMSLEPMTDYAIYKAKGEEILHEERSPGFETVIVRPATVCGYSPVMRLDLCVHILTMAALRYQKIGVYGGAQYRPNIHIDDITDAYLLLVHAPAYKVDGQTFNIGAENLTIMETAELVRSLMNEKIEIEVTETNDKRSYHVSSQKIAGILQFFPQKTVKQAIGDIKLAYNLGRIPNPDDDKYYAIRKLKKMGLKP